jgi:hypothetical protein
MAKNKNTMKKDAPAPPPPSAAIPPRGKLAIGAGGASVVLGFVVLSFADPLGRNLASKVSPFLLLAGYAAIALGLFLPPALPPAEKP